MRAGKAIGVALLVLVAAALATLWQAPPVAAAGQQAEKQTVTVYRQSGGEPVTVTVQKRAGQGPAVVTHSLQAEPLIAALGGGPRLGVQIRDLGKDDLAKLKLSSQNGVVVNEVMKESAAEKAGVKAGDVVVQFDGENVRSAAQLTRLVRETAAGRTVKMGVVRDGKRIDLDVAPAEAEATFNVAIAGDELESLEKQLKGAQQGLQYRLERRAPAPGDTFRWQPREPLVPAPEGGLMQFYRDGSGSLVFSPGRGRLGVNVQELTPELAAYFGVKDGLLVNSVQADTPAAKAGIKAGDVIGAVNGKAVVTSSELVKELADKEGEVTIGLTRDRKALSLKATLEPRKAPARRTIVVGRPA